MGASSESFFNANGLNARSNSDCDVPGTGDALLPSRPTADLDGDADEPPDAFAFPKKLAIKERDFACAACSFFSRSALAALFSSRSFS